MARRKDPRADFNAQAASGAPVPTTDTTAAVLNGEEASRAWASDTAVIDSDTALAKDPAMRSISQFNARAATPQTLDHNVSDRTRTPFKDATTTRVVSGHAKKNRSADRTRAFANAGGARARSLHNLRTGADSAGIGTMSNMLRAAAGDPRRLPDKARRQIEDVDRTIRAAERGNRYEHTVYVRVDASKVDYADQHGAEAMAHLIETGNGAYNVRGYMVGSLNMGEACSPQNHDDNELILEIKTTSGVYLGGSDSKGSDATHLIGRGRYLRPVAVQRNAPYQADNGTTGTRTIIQMIDVTPHVYTAARAGRPTTP